MFVGVEVIMCVGKEFMYYFDFLIVFVDVVGEVYVRKFG